MLSFFLYHQNLSVDHLIRKDLSFQPILYKLIVLGSLDQDSIYFGLGPQIVTLQLASSVGKTGVLAI